MRKPPPPDTLVVLRSNGYLLKSARRIGLYRFDFYERQTPSHNLYFRLDNGKAYMYKPTALRYPKKHELLRARLLGLI